MKPFTQRELLEEGFWDNFKKVTKSAGQGLKRAGRVGKFITKHAAPKTYAAAKAVKDYGKGLKDAASSIQTLAAKELKKSGYIMLPNSWEAIGKNNFVVLAKPMSEYEEVFETDPATGQPIIDPATGEPKPMIDPKTGEQKFNIGPGKPKPFIVDDQGKTKSISGKEYGSYKTKAKAAGSATPAATSTPPTASPTPISTPPVASPTLSPAPAPSPTPTPTPRRVSRGGPPGSGPRKMTARKKPKP